MQILNNLLNKLVNDHLIKLAYIEKPLSEKNDNINLHIIFNNDIEKGLYLEYIKTYLENNSFLSYSSIHDNVLHFVSEDGLTLYLHADNCVYHYEKKVIVYNPLNISEDDPFYSLKEDIIIKDIVKAIYGLTYELHNTYQYCLENEYNLGLFSLNKANNYLFQFLSDYYLHNPKNHSYNYLFTKMENIKVEMLKKIISTCKIESVMECAKMIVWFVDEYIVKLPINIAKEIEIDYYLYMKKQVIGVN